MINSKYEVSIFILIILSLSFQMKKNYTKIIYEKNKKIKKILIKIQQSFFFEDYLKINQKFSERKDYIY